MHLDLYVFLHFFLGLLAVVNPFGILTVFISLTNGQTDEQRNKTALVANLAVAIILIVSVFIGQKLLDLFSISLDAFRVAGGMLLISIAFSMLDGKLSEAKQNREEMNESVHLSQIGVVPLAMPLMAGPGAMSSTIVYAARYPGFINGFGLSITIIIFSLGTWLIFKSAPFFLKFLGKTGINVITRIMGLILASLGIEFIVGGLKVLLPGLS